MGTYLDKKRNEALSTRDAVLKHYVELHPEDFPPIGEWNYAYFLVSHLMFLFLLTERKKFADVLEQWVPIR